MAGCASPSVDSSSSESSAPASSSSSSEAPSSSAEPTLITTTIESIVNGEVAIHSYVKVSGVITFIQPALEESDSTRFYIQHGDYALSARSYVDRESIVVGDSVDIIGELKDTGSDNHYLVESRGEEDSIAKSQTTYTYNTVNTLSSAEEMEEKFGCYASLSPISFAEAEQNRYVFKASYNNFDFRIQLSATFIEETEREAFRSSIEGGTSFSYTGALIYNNSVLIIYSLDNVELLVAES